LFKYIIYSVLTNSYVIHENKQTIFNNKLNYAILFNYFRELKMKRITKLLDDLIKTTKTILDKL